MDVEVQNTVDVEVQNTVDVQNRLFKVAARKRRLPAITNIAFGVCRRFRL